MGNNAILSVLGLMVFFGIINTTLNTKNVQSSENIATYVNTDAAREIAYDGLSLARLSIDSSFANVSSFTLSGNIAGGSYVVNTVVTGDTIRVQSTGSYQGNSYTASVGLFHHIKYLPAPTYMAAVHFQASPDSTLGLPLTIDGRDHDTSGALTGTRTNDVSDVTVPTAKDSMDINFYSSSMWNSTGSPNPQGTVSRTSLRLRVDASVTPSSYIDTLVACADYVYRATGTTPMHLPNATWGSAQNPVIVYVDAGALNSAAFDSQYVGWGVLIIRGNAWAPGNLRWNGLVISYGNSVGSSSYLTLDGNSRILGSLLFMHHGQDLQVESQAQVLYSSSTLQIVKGMAKLSKYFVNTVSQWFE
ncbi:MAG: hypothetical protein ABSF91_13925 [Bacteroidota bacterium]|jgi:hypothetical protein